MELVCFISDDYLFLMHLIHLLTPTNNLQNTNLFVYFIDQEVKLGLQKLESPVTVALETKAIDSVTVGFHENHLRHLLSVNWDNLKKLYKDRLA